jgi:hypothetical protein
MVGLYPLSQVIADNAGVLPLSGLLLARSFMTALIATGLLLFALRPVQRDLATRSIWLAAILFLFGLYGSAIATVQDYGGHVDSGSPWLAGAFALGSIAVATIATRPWQVRRRDSTTATILAALLIGFNLVRGLATAITGGIGAPPKSFDSPGATLASRAKITQTRDIYYVVLDGFGRADVLRRYYDTDLSTFVDFLKSRGFSVPDQSQSNYAQTFLSLASTLNMTYLDDVAAARTNGSRDRRPLQALIHQNALMAAAKRAGYRVIAIGSDYLATHSIEAADVCACQQYGLDEIQTGMLALTPFAGLPLDRWTYGAHRRNVIEAFKSLETLSGLPGPKLVFVHVIAPHPPFVFGPDGGPRQPTDRFFGFHDGDHFRGSKGEYFSGYRDQVQFVVHRLQVIVGSLLSRPGTKPVIVLHGDHGPGSMLSWEDADATNMGERMGIFAAYHFPDGPTLYPTITPVNGARALASQYLGVDLSFLPDRSFFSAWMRPYDFIPVSQPASPLPALGHRSVAPRDHADAQAHWADGASNIPVR